MLNTYLEIAQHLFDNMPDINWIDRDKGQIDNEEEFHSLICPAILLNFGETTWTGLTRGSQLGDLTITTKLIFVKPIDTFTRGTNPLQEYAHFNALSDELHDVVRNYPSVGERRRSADYFTRYWYVIENQYDLQVSYDVPIKTIPRPKPIISTNLIIPNES